MVIKFSNRLKELREKKELTQLQLSKIFNVHKTTISNWESGKRFPDENILNMIADFFNVTMDYLLGRTEIENAQVIVKEIDGHKYEFEVEKPEDLLDLIGNGDKYGLPDEVIKKITDGLLETLVKTGVLKI